MKLNVAMRILSDEKVFLGVTWEQLLTLLKEKPTSFPDRTVEAFEVYKAEIA